MTKSTSNKLTAEELLKMIPDSLLEDLSDATGVDHQVKKMFGKNMFYLLLYGYLESTKISLRELEDIYNSQKFKFLFNIDQQSQTHYNSLSDRLATMNPEYFKKIYEFVYATFAKRFTPEESESHSIVRVDSTLVTETANKLREGMIVGNQYHKKKQVKYTLLMTDIFPCGAEIFTSQEEHNENKTIPLAIFNHADKSGIFVFDRGVNKRDIFTDFCEQGIQFVTRINPKARYELISSAEIKVPKCNNLVIISDQFIRLYNQQSKLSAPYRLIRTQREKQGKEEICFLTNCFDLNIDEIIAIYHKRWDIEVFFRFIKQELNFSHFVSTTLNGIKIVLYLTLILAILILMYKKSNNLGYKTAVRRFRIELDELITKMLITFSGGDPSLVFR